MKAFILLLFIFSCKLDYKFDKLKEKKYNSFEEFYSEKLKISKEKNHRPGCEEKLIRHSKTKSKYAILYLHGFGACMKEGELIVDKIANKFKYNTYYIRQPGHGTNMYEHRDTKFNEYLDADTEALNQMDLLGDKLILIGTSMGGLVSTYLTAKNPEKIHALVLASPYYEFGSTSPKVLEYPGGIYIAYLVSFGRVRDSSRKNSPRKKNYLEGYDDYWYTKQYFSALHNLIDLKNYINEENVFGEVKVPTLVFYFQNEIEQDRAASVDSIKEVYSKFQPNPKSKLVQVKNGSHILMSEFVVSDHELIEKELTEFISKLDK